jgi:hypothetical protein
MMSYEGGMTTRTVQVKIWLNIIVLHNDLVNKCMVNQPKIWRDYYKLGDYDE